LKGQFTHSTGLARRTLVLLFAVVLMAVGAPLSAFGYSVDHFAGNASQESLLSEMTIQPAAIRRDGFTYIAYQGPGYDPYVAVYDEAGGYWRAPQRVGLNPLFLDAHGAPALYFDQEGALHAIYGSHWSEMRHVKMETPGDIYNWVEAPSVTTRGTYPQAIEDATNTALFYRADQHHWVMHHSEEPTDTFSEPVRILEADAENAFYADFSKGPTGKIHAAWVRMDRQGAPTDIQSRFDAFYAYRDTDGKWYNAASEEVTLPITPDKANDKCLVYTSRRGATNEITVREDITGAPCVLFLSGEGEGPGAFTWRFDRYSEAEGDWVETEITTADEYFDSGAIHPKSDGSLEAFLVGDESDTPGAPKGRGGGIGRWVSSDNGLTWSLADVRITPDDPLGRFADPHIVEGGDDTYKLAFVEWTNDPTNFFQRIFLWGENGYVGRDAAATPWRLAGSDRIGTSLAISEHSFSERASVAVLATAYDFPDALSGTPLAQAMRGPLLLTRPTELDPRLAEEINRLKIKKVVILGGFGVVNKDVENQLVEQTGVVSIERLGGNDRYQTAQLIGMRLQDFSDVRGEAVVVSGRDWPDAVGAAPLAATLGIPIVLASGEELRPEMTSLLAEWETSSTVIAGGTGAVSESIEASLPDPVRLGGANRYETSGLLAEYGLERGLLPHRLLFATGVAFPDALCASALAARVRGPVVLLPPDDLTTPARKLLAEHGTKVTDAFFIGGEGALDASIPRDVRPYTE